MLIRLAFSLILGMVLTIFVAWVGAWHFQQSDEHEYSCQGVYIRNDEEVIYLAKWRERLTEVNIKYTAEKRLPGDDLQKLRLVKDAFQGMLPDKSDSRRRNDDHDFYGAASHPSLQHLDYIANLEAGFPMRCLWMQQRPASMQALIDRLNWETGISLNAKGWRPQQYGQPALRLPIRPLPLGFAANTCFWSLASFAVLAVPVFVRRHLRRRKGLCPRCAYNREFTYTVPCPECGLTTTAVPTRS